jgi:hypothetical protein
MYTHPAVALLAVEHHRTRIAQAKSARLAGSRHPRLRQLQRRLIRAAFDSGWATLLVAGQARPKRSIRAYAIWHSSRNVRGITVAHDNPDQQPPDRPEPTREESEPAPSKRDQAIYAVKRGVVAGVATISLYNPLAAPLHDNGDSRPQGTSRDNGAEIARPNENTKCRPASDDRTMSQLSDPEIGIYGQPARERATVAGPGPEFPEQPRVPEPEIHLDPEGSVEESGRDPNGWSGGDLEVRPHRPEH